MKSQNSHLEAVGKKLGMKLPPEEIRSLLWVNPKSKKYERLDSFYEANKKVLIGLYGKEDTKEKFKQDLRRRWNVIEDLLYFKDLEANLSTKEEQNIRRESRSIKGKVSTVLEWTGAKRSLGKKIQQLRETRDQDIISGDVTVNEELIVEYVELVRKELQEQITKIQQLEESPSDKKELKDMYEKASSLVHFMISRSNLPEDQKRYITAFLLKKIRSEQGFELVQEFFRQSFLTNEDAQQGQNSINLFLKQFIKPAQKSRKESLFELLEKYAPEVDYSENAEHLKELEDLLKHGVRSAGDVTYNQRIALRLQEIEMAEYQIHLEKMIPGERTEQTVSEWEAIIRSEANALGHDLQNFRTEKYTMETFIEELPEDVANVQKKERIRTACYFLRNQKNEPEETIKKSLLEVDSNEKAEAFLVNAERTAEEYLWEKDPSYDEESLEMLRKNDPGFDIFQRVSDRERFANRPAPIKDKPSEYFEGEELKTIEEHIVLMEKIAGQNFSGADDVKKFETAQEAVKQLIQKSTYQVKIPSFVKKDPLTSKDINEDTETEERQKRVPPHLLVRYEAVYSSKVNSQRFSKSRKTLLQMTNLEDETQLREGLSAIFMDSKQVSPSKLHTVQKLTKVMSLDHPVTCIRFNAADQKPYDDKRGIYDFHKGKDNKPATFKQRAKELIKNAQLLIQSGDYAGLHRLFAEQASADRLYQDAKFFPVSSIRDESKRDGILYETVATSEKDEKAGTIQVLTSKIPKVYKHYFKAYEEKDSDEYKRMVKQIEKDTELNQISLNLDQDDDFTASFEGGRNHSLPASYREDPDGNVTVRTSDLPPNMVEGLRSEFPELFETRTGGAVLGAGLTSPEDLRIPKNVLEKIATKTSDYPGYPLIAARAARFNSLGAGYALGGLEYLGRDVADVARLPFQFARSYGNAYWKGMKFYSFMHIYVTVKEFYEHVANLADFRVKFKAYTLLKNTFAGTIIGSEFAKLQQSKENERVDAFKGAFAQYGNEDIRDKLLNPRDRFELKATMIEGFDNRGLFTIEDILKNDVFDVINKYTTNYIIPKKYSDEEMLQDPDKKAEMTNHVRAAFDEIWGQGTWSGWRTNGAAKYESNRKAANDNFNNNTGGEKMKVFTQWWEYLTQPEEGNPLNRIAPAELVGSIENDMQRCNRDSGEIFAIMQALICKGYIRLEHLSRLQDTHTNDLPIFTLLRPEQARLCGLTDYIDQALKDKNAYNQNENPIVQFYQGTRAFELEAKRDVGKWSFADNKKDFEKDKKEGRIQKTSMTVHELQKNREPQPEYIRKMDNGVTGIFGPAYSIEKILNSYQRNAQGDIDARDHDVVALYRGMHVKMASYIQAFSDMDAKPTPKRGPEEIKREFKRSVWNAYNEIGKSSAFGTFLAQHVERKDYDINLADGSPNYDKPVNETRGYPKGLSSFEKLIIPNTGRAQRLNESNDILDAMDGGNNFKDFRKEFKYMTGYQYTLGVGPDGKRGTRPQTYDRKEFSPAKHYKKVMDSFYKMVLDKAKEKEKDLPGFYEEMKQSLDRSNMANFNINNHKRQESLGKWKSEEAKLD